jgi:hypothetical protein
MGDRGTWYQAIFYASLRAEVLIWLLGGTGHPPDAVNIWIGGESSTTSIHAGMHNASLMINRLLVN